MAAGCIRYDRSSGMGVHRHDRPESAGALPGAIIPAAANQSLTAVAETRLLQAAQPRAEGQTLAERALAQSQGSISSKSALIMNAVVSFLNGKVNSAAVQSVFRDCACAPEAWLSHYYGGETLLTGMLHLPFSKVFNIKTHLAKKRILELFRLLREQSGVIGQEVYIQLLTNVNAGGFTPLLAAVKTGIPEVFNEVFAEIKSGILPRELYKKTLLSMNRDRFNILHAAAMVGKWEIFHPIFSEIIALHECNFLSDKDYKCLLTSQNKVNFTPLLQAMKTGGDRIFSEFFGEIILNHRKIMSDEEYVGFLTSPNDSGFTPLLQAVIADDLTVFVIFNNVLLTLCGRLIPAEMYMDALLEENMFGYNCILSAFSSPSEEILLLCLRGLKKLCAAGGLLTLDDYKKALLYKNSRGHTALHVVMRSRNKTKFRTLFAEIAELRGCGIIEIDEYRSFLLANNAYHYSPMHHAIRSCDDEILGTYLRELSALHESGIISDGEFARTITCRSRPDYLLLHEAICTNNPAIFCRCLAEISSLYNSSLISTGEYVGLLTGAADHNVSPMQRALEYQRVDVVIPLAAELCRLYQMRAISGKIYREQLLCRFSAGKTPMHIACSSLNFEYARTYFDELAKLLAFELITPQEIVGLIKQRDASRTSLLDHLAINGDSEFASYVINECLIRYLGADLVARELVIG